MTQTDVAKWDELRDEIFLPLIHRAYTKAAVELELHRKNLRAKSPSVNPQFWQRNRTNLSCLHHLMDHYYSKVLITNAKLSRLTDANPSTISSILKEARELGLVTPDQCSDTRDR